MTNSKLTDEQLQEIYGEAVSCEVAEKNGVYMASFDLLCKMDDVGGTAYTVRKLIDMLRAERAELQERRKADSDGMSAGNYCYHYKAEGENGCYAGVANVSDQVVDWNTFQAFKITVGRLNGDKITGITSLSFLGEVNKS